MNDRRAGIFHTFWRAEKSRNPFGKQLILPNNMLKDYSTQRAAGEDGWPHAALLSVGEVLAVSPTELLVAIWPRELELCLPVRKLAEMRSCGACGQVYTAQEPEGVGAEKYDETAAAMIAQLKYGSGTPFYRLEQLQGQLGIPLPAATQWEVVEEAAELLKPARDELIRQAAQGEVVHNDDTSMRVLRLTREPSDERTGVFTSGIVSTSQGWKIALYFTGRQHAGENLADVLKQRARYSAAALSS
jgi:hypothetical protein